MKYRVLVDKRALQELARFQRDVQQQIAKRLRMMEDSPFHNAKKLKGRPGYRIRSGDYRILFDVNEAAVTVTVFAIGDRKDIYR